MATYEDVFNLVFPSLTAYPFPVVKRLWVAGLIWAGAITAEDPTTSNHANRLVIARGVNAQLKGKMDTTALPQVTVSIQRFAVQVFNDYPSGGITDSDALAVATAFLDGIVAP